MYPVKRSIRELGATIRRRRKAAGLTAAQAAEWARVSRRLLVEVEGGKRPNVGLAAVLRILTVLGLDMEVRTRGLPGTRTPAAG
jgi:transcriptional regulator with XRE-family HTH domain